MNRLQRIWAFREGGQTKRCHTMNYIGHYDVAQHSFNMLNMLFILHPNPSHNLIQAIMYHDFPERWTGDMPTTAKAASPEIKEKLEELECKILKKFDILHIFSMLPEDEKNWLNGLDLLELAFWAEEQCAMGNSMIARMHAQIRNIFLSKMDIFPAQITQLYFNEFGYERSPECNELLEEA